MNDNISNNKMRIFSENELIKGNFILKNKYSKLSELTSDELKNLAIVWCYYSGKIEGNTYTYVETEALLKDGVTSPKKYDDAKMLKNLYNAFITLLAQARNKQHIVIDRHFVFTCHSMITDDLIEDKDRGLLREKAVGITGTMYEPPKEKEEIEKMFTFILKEQTLINPLERAVYLHCNMARLQPFIDGNKRTARLLESVVLMNAGIIPVYSAKDEDILNYRKGVISFYETQDYTMYNEFFLNRQIERINSLSLRNEQTYDIKNNKVVDNFNELII